VKSLEASWFEWSLALSRVASMVSTEWLEMRMILLTDLMASSPDLMRLHQRNLMRRARPIRWMARPELRLIQLQLRSATDH